MKLTRSMLCTILLAIGLATASHAATPDAAPALATPWSAPATASVVVEERDFTNGPAHLHGTLIRPVTDAKVPVVIALHAASAPLRDMALYRHLVNMLPPLGIGVFVYDRRGSGQSGTETAHGEFNLLADDGIAALHTLAHDPHVDASRIGFWGLSQGGWLSLLATSRSKDAAFAVSISAPMTTPDVQMNFAVANILHIKGYSQADIDLAIDARTAVDQFARGQLDRPATQLRLDRAIGQPWFDLAYLDKTFADPGKSSWAREIRLDPLDTLEKVTAPTLILYGARDPWVPVKRSAELVHTMQARKPNLSLRVVSGADHNMMLSVPPEVQIEPAKLGELAPESAEYFGLLAAWLQAQGIARVPR